MGLKKKMCIVLLLEYDCLFMYILYFDEGIGFSVQIFFRYIILSVKYYVFGNKNKG